MKCKKAERLLLQSLDRALSKDEREKLGLHLKSCFLCQKKEREYGIVQKLLREKDVPDTLPLFWERLDKKLKEKEKDKAWIFWPQKAWRMASFVLALILVVGGALLIFLPQNQEELSQAEALLLRDENPLLETRALLDEQKIDNKNMMLIFAAAEEKGSPRRY